MQLKEVDRVEITTVIDNVSDLLAMDSGEVVQRVQLVRDGKMERETGGGRARFLRPGQAWSADQSHLVLFDAGLSSIAVPFNLRSLGIDLAQLEALALSHGHLDHFGALLPLLEMLPRKPISLVLHPDAFITPRYLKFSEDFKVFFPELVREELKSAGAELVETTGPRLMAGDCVLFLGEVERVTDFEKGMAISFCVKDGREQWDPISDDTALVVNLKGKGLVIVSGCAHSGIIQHGGAGPQGHRRRAGPRGHRRLPPQRPRFRAHHRADGGGDAAPGPPVTWFRPTARERRPCAPSEQAMPEAYLRNLSGTRLTFAS